MGLYLLSCSALFVFLQFMLTFFKKFDSFKGQKIIETFASLSCFATLTAFSILILAFIESDLSYLIVALNSHPSTELLYKITGVWGSHEGSLLLWLLLVSVVTVIMIVTSKDNQGIRKNALQIIGFISLCFHLFILLTANPFVRLQQVPKAGLGLNPLLEDPSLAIHPPLLYAGLALLIVPFALTCAHLKQHSIDSNWARQLRFWVLTAWCFLTAGISLGSWWAYYELGWGGWWFWDPVENVSLLPWITTTALMHSLIVVEKKNEQNFFASLLALMSFVLVIFGFALVRSGILQSVHSFGVDYNRGVFFFLMSGFVMVYAGKQMIQNSKWDLKFNTLYSRSAFILLNVITLICMLVLILIGTLYPVIIQLFFKSVLSIDATYFNTMMSPFVIFLLVGLVVLPFLNWFESSKLNSKLAYISSIVLGTLLVIRVFYEEISLLNSIILALACGVMIAIIMDLYKKRSVLKNMGSRYFSMSLSHFAIALLLVAVILDKEFEKEQTTSLKLNQAISFQGFDVTLDEVKQVGGPYFQMEKAYLDFAKLGAHFTMSPEKRYFMIHDVITSETALKSVGLADLYVVLGNYQDQDRWGIKISWHPFVRLIWISAFLLICSGSLSLLSLLYRYWKLRRQNRKEVLSSCELS